jgi:outer membrane protein OmpA-like peptidoglycan-associated protein
MQRAHAAEIEALDKKLAEADEAVAKLQGQIQASEAQQARELAAVQEAMPQRQPLVDEVAGLGGRETDDGVVVRLGGDVLQFASGSAALPAEVPSLERIADLMQRRPEVRARIEGYTDSVGSSQLNQALSERRAQAVLQRLVERGIDSSRLTAEGLGEERPIGDNATAQGRSENRRVEIYLMAAGSEAPGAG